MTGFSAEWLALREPVDHRSRSVALRDRLVRVMADRVRGRAVRILDLGCGAGSNLRALAPCLGAEQQWTLVDYDPMLLQAARETVSHWADTVLADGEALLINKAGRRIEVRFQQCDLAAAFKPLLAATPDLVTAAALFDLVSSDWIRQFCACVESVFYTVLTYNGTERWIPEHPADANVLSAFHTHQTTDKGFGVAAGPGATDILRESLKARGFSVEIAASPWILGQDDRALLQALCTGSAGAVEETGLVAKEILADWLTTHREAIGGEIGHWDLLAVPDAE